MISQNCTSCFISEPLIIVNQNCYCHQTWDKHYTWHNTLESPKVVLDFFLLFNGAIQKGNICTRNSYSRKYKRLKSYISVIVYEQNVGKYGHMKLIIQAASSNFLQMNIKISIFKAPKSSLQRLKRPPKKSLRDFNESLRTFEDLRISQMIWKDYGGSERISVNLRWS